MRVGEGEAKRRQFLAPQARPSVLLQSTDSFLRWKMCRCHVSEIIMASLVGVTCRCLCVNCFRASVHATIVDGPDGTH